MMTELIKELHRYLSCDPDNGKLYWKHRNKSMEPKARARNAFNTRFAGKEAFTALNSGYKVGGFFGNTLRAHRVIWAMTYGEWPDQIDHINGDRQDNRLSNLRNVSASENGANKAMLNTNKSGVTGVHFFERTKSWAAYINSKKKKIHLGYFKDKNEAIEIRQFAEELLGYHPNHGRAA